MEQALRDVDDALLRQADPLEQGPEVPFIRLVRTHLLGGDDPVEVDAEPAVRGREQVVVAVRQHGESEPTLETAEGLRRIGERRPILDRSRKRLDLVIAGLEAQLLTHASQTGRKDLGIRPVRAALGGRFVVRIPSQDVLGVGVDPVRGEHRTEGGAEPGLPVDERPVAVEGQRLDIGEVDRVRHPRNCSRSGIVGSSMRSIRTLAWVLLPALLVLGCAGAAASPRPSPPGGSGPVTTQADAVARVIAAEPRFARIGPRDPSLIGQSSWYEVVPASGVGAFLVTIRIGWGDCPAGCIDEHTWLYAVGPDGAVTLQSETGSPVPDDAWPARDAGDQVEQGLHITAVAGPTCPVERFPPDPACAPKRVPNVSVEIVDDQGNPQGMVVLDGTGQQSVSLEPGTYTVTAQGATGFMSGPEPQRVVVEPGRITDVTLTYDTGIR
jgi:hypothetical protein